MSNSDTDVGHWRITQAKLSSFDQSTVVDISNMIDHVIISENIESPSITCEITVVDSIGLIDNFPIRGEEILSLEIEDTYDQRLANDWMIVDVSSIEVNTQQNAVTYRLIGITPHSMYSASTEIRQSYLMTLSDAAKVIMESEIVDRINTVLFPNSRYPFDVEDTTDVQTFIVPALTPLNAISHLAAKSFSSDNISSNFKFFQTRKRFVFKTHEQLVQDMTNRDFPRSHVYTFDPTINADIQSKERIVNNIHKMTIDRYASSIQTLNQGGMINTVVNINPLTREIFDYRYDYNQEFDDYKHIDVKAKRPYSEIFRNEFFVNSVVDRSVIVDDSNRSPRYNETTTRRTSSQHFLNSTVATIEIYGTNDITVGDIIRIDIPQFHTVAGVKDPHENLSGYWLITNTRHMFDEKDYIITATVVKDHRRGSNANI